jgi:hypothetical protein
MSTALAQQISRCSEALEQMAEPVKMEVKETMARKAKTVIAIGRLVVTIVKMANLVRPEAMVLMGQAGLMANPPCQQPFELTSLSGM